MLTRLQIRDFRCFSRLEVEFGGAATVFVGANAQGKTSLLEAICVLLRLQSPRVSAMHHVIRHGARGFVVDGHFGSRHLQFYYAKERKKLALDEVEQKTAREYLGVGRVVCFSNDDIEIVRGPAEGRRRFLDFVAQQVEPGYRTTLRAYERAVRARNRLLKQPQPVRREIAAFDVPLVENGTRLLEMRGRVIAALQPAAAAAHLGISQHAEECVVRYAPGVTGGLPEALAAAADDDFRRGMTTVGPHRDDLAITLNEVDSLYASEGQQRSIVLALRLAQERLLRQASGEPPVLLVDDIFGELDHARRNALLTALPADSQQFFTTTHLDWIQRADLAVFRVAKGAVEK